MKIKICLISFIAMSWLTVTRANVLGVQRDSEFTSAEPSGTDEGDLQPTFSSISKNIFTPKCAMCHGPGASEEKLPVSNYNFLIKMLWIVPYNLEQSQLYESVNTGRMPIGQKLTQPELDAISQWITDGAKNN